MLIPCPPFVLIETSSKSRRLFDNDDPSVVSITFFLFFLSFSFVCVSTTQSGGMGVGHAKPVKAYSFRLTSATLYGTDVIQ